MIVACMEAVIAAATRIVNRPLSIFGGRSRKWLTAQIVRAYHAVMINRLRSMRARAGLSGGELSRLAGLARAHVGLIESRAIKTIEAPTAAALATVLGCSLDWLVLGQGEAPSDAALAAAVNAARARRAAERTGETAEVALP